MPTNSQAPAAPQPRRVPGRFVVYFIFLFAVLVAFMATWSIITFRKLPPEAFVPVGIAPRKGLNKPLPPPPGYQPPPK